MKFGIICEDLGTPITSPVQRNLPNVLLEEEAEIYFYTLKEIYQFAKDLPKKDLELYTFVNDRGEKLSAKDFMTQTIVGKAITQFII